MKIQIASDLHFEFHSSPEDFIDELKSDCDVLILAGDIANEKIAKDCLPIFADKFKQIIYVAGNHEFYFSTRERLFEAIEKITSKYSNIHFLNKSSVSIGDRRFLGATLWFGKNNLPKLNSMNDFSKIKRFNWVYQENADCINFFKNNLQRGDVAISHHLPTINSIMYPYKENPINAFYVSDISDTIKERSPKLWVHGHSHESVDYIFENTRIVSNPFGYLNYETNNNFSFYKIVEI